MNVQFDWQAADERGRWETIATSERHPAFRVSRRVWRMLLLAVLVVAVGGTLNLRPRYQTALRRLTSDLQAAIDLETWALQQRDRDLYLALQDEASPRWYGQQEVRYLLYRDPCASSGRQEDCSPGSHPQVKEVQVRKEVAWVEVIADYPPKRYARFYRRTDGGWVRTAPRPEFWRDPVERSYGSVTVRAHSDDLAHVEPLIEHLVRAVDEVSAALDDGGHRSLEVEFVSQDLPGQVPGLKEGRLILASPWLTGIPVEGAWDPEYLDTLDYWAAYWVASQYVQAPARASGSADSMSLLHRALVDEYAVLYSRGDVARAPILSQVIKQHDLDLLPEMLISLREPENVSAFFERWLLASQTSDEMYLHTLADIGWEAFVGGRVESYSLVHQALAREGTNLADLVECRLYP